MELRGPDFAPIVNRRFSSCRRLIRFWKTRAIGSFERHGMAEFDDIFHNVSNVRTVRGALRARYSI